MKNLFLTFALIFGLSSFSTATNIETVNTQTVEEDLFGTCHIRIYDSEDNLVYEAFLPANSAEACQQMLENTLEAMN